MENIFYVIWGRNIKSVSIGRWKAEVPFVSHHSIMDSTRTSEVEPRFVSFVAREIVCDVCFHARDNNLRYAFGSNHSMENQNSTLSGHLT